MANQDTRMKLIETTKQLLEDGVAIKELTARRISSEAGTNLAMINYCFKSKDELVKIAVDQIISKEFKAYAMNNTKDTPKVQLRNLLLYICKAVVKYEAMTRASMPYLILEDEIKLPLELLPYVREHYKGRKSEEECRLIAFDLVYSFQLMFYRAEAFGTYAGINVLEEQSLAKLIDMQLNLMLVE